MAGTTIDKKKIQEVFNSLDLDKNGYLDHEEFAKAMEDLGLQVQEIDKAFSVVSGIKRRKNWGDMSLKVKENWQILGFSEDTWGGRSATIDLNWTDLSKSQKDAATALGYTRDVWDSSGAEIKAGAGISLKMLIDAIESASDLQVRVTRVLTRQMSMSDKKAKIEEIREMMAQREPGARKNAARIAAIRNQRLLGGSSFTTSVPKKVDTIQSQQKRDQVNAIKARYNITT